MSKCQHGQKITIFCVSQCCVWKQIAGCDSCMKKYHNHMGPTNFLSEKQIQNIIKKFNVEPTTKPQCRTLQQTIFNYFNLIKTEFVSFVDNACMDIIRQIGHPYLAQCDLLNTYKKLKKKDYKNIQQKQLRNFYQTTQNIAQSEIVSNQTKIYIEIIQKNTSFINTLQQLMRSIQKLNHQLQLPYLPAHDGTINLKINQLLKNISKIKSQHSSTSPIQHPNLIQSAQLQSKYEKQQFTLANKLKKIKTYYNQGADTNDTSEKEKSKNQLPNDNCKIKEQKDNDDSNKAVQKETVTIKNQQQQPIIQKQPQLDKKKQRTNSIDKHFMKSNILQKRRNPQKPAQDSQKKPIPEPQKPQLQILKPKQQQQPPKIKDKAKHESSPKRKIFQSKQLQISQKKQKLIGMMKLKQQQISKQLQKPLMNKDKSNKSSQNKISSNDSDSQLQQTKDPNHYAQTILPINDEKQKLFQDSEQVTQKTIIVPVQNGLQKIQLQQCVSPLLKSRIKSNKNQKNDQKGNKSKQLRSESPPKKQKKEEYLMDLTELQQKSLALLIKSLDAKAEQAVVYLQTALQYAEDNLSAAQYLTYLYLELDKPKQCLTVCNKMMQKLSNSSNSSQLSWLLNINKCAALNKLGRYSQSIVILEETLKHKQNPKLYKNLGDAYFLIGIYEKSYYYYEKAVSLQDNYDEAHYNLAVCQFMQQNYHNANFSVGKALHYSPTNQTYLQLQKQINLRIKDL